MVGPVMITAVQLTVIVSGLLTPAPPPLLQQLHVAGLTSAD